VERNLRAPIIGVANVAAARGDAHALPTVAVRTGDTAARDRARFQREPADILITTPESLYLLLTSNAREALRSVETVIVDEIHALVPTKRGAHLASPWSGWSTSPGAGCSGSVCRRLSVRWTRSRGSWAAPPSLSPPRRQVPERGPVRRSEPPRSVPGRCRASDGNGEHSPPAAASSARPDERASAQAPLDPGETGASVAASETAGEELRTEFAGGTVAPEWRPVTIVDAGARRTLELRIEVPVEDMARIGEPIEIPLGPAAQGPVRSSIWTAIHPRSWTWCASTGPRSSSSTAGASPSGSRRH
jgi:ATP-dependent Lhr-like helicase